MLASPKPTIVTALPAVISSVSQPIAIGTIGTSVTACASLHTAKSLPPPGPPPGYVWQNEVGTLRPGPLEIFSPRRTEV